MPVYPRVFISYSRKDGEDFAADLRRRIEAEDIPLWQDRVGMEGGRDWWLQIVEALNKVEFMVPVMTPESLKSQIIRKEWRYARQKGVCVYPVKGVSDSILDYQSLPHWMTSAHFYDIEYEWKKLVNDLNTRCQALRVPFMAEELPEDFVQRDEEYDCLIGQLLDMDLEQPLAITAALLGAGGYGKTTLAKAICHDERIQEAFDDGILWVTLGETPGDLTGKIEDLIYVLSGERPGFSDSRAAASYFAEHLADRDILLVIDDVWNRAHLTPFLQGGKHCARLITTRNRDTLPPNSTQINLDAMRQAEAISLLQFDIPEKGDSEIQELAHRLGEWPLLLKLVNATLRERVKIKGQSLSAAISYINKALDKRGLTFFDSRNAEERSQAVSTTLKVSIDLINEDENDRFYELAIFQEEVDIPIETVEKLWSHAGYDYFDTETLCDRLHRLSLLLNFDPVTNHIRLHDVVRNYLLIEQADKLPQIHYRFLEAYRLKDWTKLPSEEPYLWKYLAYHLFLSKQTQTLRELLFNYSWLDHKLGVGNANSLLSDFDFFPEDNELRMIQSALRLSSNQLTKDRGQLTSHLIGRLKSQKSSGIQSLLDQSIRKKESCWLRPTKSSLTLPGGPLIRTLEGHSNYVTALAITPDSQFVVSGSWDRTLRIWDIESGDLMGTLEGHSDSVEAVAISPDGKHVVSGSKDNTLKVWALESAELVHTLEGHSSAIIMVAITPDSQFAVSGSDKGVLKFWDIESGSPIHTLEGNSDYVAATAITPDFRYVISGSDEGVLKIRDLESGDLLATAQGHSHAVQSVAITSDGQYLLSGSFDQTLKVWNLESGDLIETLEDHEGAVRAIAITPDGGRVVSGSLDLTLKVWNFKSGDLITTLQGHTGIVDSVAITPNGQYAVSGSWDHTLKVWDLESKELNRALYTHSFSVKALAITPDGRYALSVSWEETLMIWNTESGDHVSTLEGNSKFCETIAITPDGKRAISGSGDHTLKVWDLESAELIHRLTGHSSFVTTVAITPNGKYAVSGSEDDTLKVWDLESAELIYTLEGHSGPVSTVAITPNGQYAVSGSGDSTLKIWDIESGGLMRTLEGHDSGIRAVAITPDGRYAVSGSWDKLNVWDIEAGDLVRGLEDTGEFFDTIAITPDGKRVISSPLNQTLKVWDLESMELISTLKGHMSDINAVAISPDGQYAVSGARDNMLKVWDLKSMQEIASFISESSIEGCLFTPDGMSIIAGEVNGSVHILRLENF